MYGIFTYIHHKNQPNVSKYIIHGSYGYGEHEKRGLQSEHQIIQHLHLWPLANMAHSDLKYHVTAQPKFKTFKHEVRLKVYCKP